MSDAPADVAPTPAEQLVELQRLDSEIDQLTHRRANLPEGVARDEAAAALADWERVRDELQGRIEQLGEEIATADERSGDLGTDKQRLEAQMKTVIAPREAEALMHEIATIDEQRDQIETAELEALESQAATEQQLVDHTSGESAIREALAVADADATAATAQIDDQVAALMPRRDGARAAVAAGALTRYDRLRGHHQIAVAQLAGKQCTGCHLDLSAAEVDDVKDEAAAADGVADCPQCGRMLVV